MFKGLGLLFVAVVTGCGSSAQQPVSSSSASTQTQPESATTAPTKEKPTLESQRAPFIEGCMESIQSKDYCECGFGEFAILFKDADFSQEMPKDDPRMGQLAIKMKEKCSDKYPEPKAKEQFLQGCAENEAKKDPYCNCAWTELRKSLSVGDILTYLPGNTKFAQAKQGIPAACKGKYPAELASNDFVAACQKDGKKTEKQCQCMWKKVNKKYTVEELVAGVGDPSKVPGLDQCK